MVGMLHISVGTCHPHCGICPVAWNNVSLCHRIHGILLKVENTCCGVRTSCLESHWSSLARGPGGTSLWIEKVLHSCWSSWASSPGCRKIETSASCVQWYMFLSFSLW